MSVAEQNVKNTAPVFLCADPDESERLTMRDLNAICPPVDAATAMLHQYRGATVLVTPRGRQERLGVAIVLHTLGCDVHALDPPFTAEVDDPATCPAKPMFPKVPDTEPTANDGITIGGALTLAQQMPDVEYVLSPILTKGQLGTLTARPNHGKTTFMTGLCAALALDLPFGPITPAAAGLVYIVSAEDFQGTRNRIIAEAARHELEGDQRVQLDVRWRWVQVDKYANATEIMARVEVDAAGREVALIFVDTGPALFPGADENDNIQLRDFVESFRQWKDLPGNPVTVLAWHPAKGATSDRLEPRGASAITGTTDFNLTLWKEDDRVTLDYTKIRSQHFDIIEGNLSALEIVAASGARYFAPVVALDTTEKPEGNEAQAAREALLIRMFQTRTNPTTVRDLAAAVGASKSTVQRHLKHLSEVRSPLVTKDAVNDRFVLTKAGVDRAKAALHDSKKEYLDARDPS